MKVLKNIIKLGTLPNDNESLFIQTTRLNSLAIFTLIAIGIYITMHILFDSNWVAIAFDSVYIITALLILYFQAKRKYLFAYYTVGIGYTIAFACSSILIGAQNQVEYLIFISTLGTAMLFDDKWTKRGFFIFGFITFLCLKFFQVINPKGLLNIDFSPLFMILNGTVVFGVIYFIVDSALESSKQYSDKLLLKNEEITQLNTTLEQKVAERTKEIEQQSKALRQSNAELKRFSYIAAHDLREPLRNILGFSQLMQKDVLQQQYDNLKEYNRYINWSVHRMDSITRGIVDYTELEDLLKNTQELNLNTIINDVLKEQSDVRKDVIFEINTLPNLLINEKLLKTVFKQLIENAVQYCDKPQPIIKINYSETIDFHQFSITDNGIGIAPEFNEKIFVMFKRLHNDIQKNGSGIGLSICKKVIESYGGNIWVKSVLKEGSTFYFTLPK